MTVGSPRYMLITVSIEQIAALFHDLYPAPLRGQQQRLERQALAPPSKRESDKLLPR